jgi:hypothetical protein
VSLHKRLDSLYPYVADTFVTPWCNSAIKRWVGGGISSTNTTLIGPRRLLLTDTMTIVSDDASLWPLISYFRGYSYYTGMWGVG